MTPKIAVPKKWHATFAFLYICMFQASVDTSCVITHEPANP
jgi:hypothetical protein